MKTRKIICAAKTRAGHPCKRKALRNGRCPNHGGKSTGPKTTAGRQRIAQAQRRRWAAWRKAKAYSFADRLIASIRGVEAA
jgi:hypothetical protein